MQSDRLRTFWEITPVLEFSMGSQELKELTFLGKRNNEIFKKKSKYPIFGPFLPKFGQK